MLQWYEMHVQALATFSSEPEPEKISLAFLTNVDKIKKNVYKRDFSQK